MKFKQFKNGTFNLKASELGEDIAYDIAYDISLDFAPFGEIFSLGNYAMAQSYYNAQTGYVYIVSTLDQDAYAEGKTVKLKPYPISEEDREQMEQEGIL